MDPRIVDAVRSIKALEDGDLDADEEVEMHVDEDAEDGQGNAKRRRIDNGETQSQAPLQPLLATPSQPPPSNSLLSAETLEGLRYFAEIQKNRGVTLSSKPADKKPAGGLGVLGAYGSDDESD
jgi:hypothetical protein